MTYETSRFYFDSRYGWIRPVQIKDLWVWNERVRRWERK